MKDTATYELLRRRKPHHAEGRVRIDLTDPITRKVKNRIEGKNHIFEESLFLQHLYQSSPNFQSSWPVGLSSMPCLLTNNTRDIDSDLPFVLGDLVGAGNPSSSGGGLYYGAYNAANQILALRSLDSIRWKFQYDFTTAQANGTIGTIGLTRQVSTISRGRSVDGWTPPSITGLSSYYTSEGRYQYRVSTAGVVTIYDVWNGTSSNVDVSAIVGTASGDVKGVAIAPATGKYYIYVYSSTAANRKLYKFSSNTFSNLEATYTVSNINFGSSSSSYPMFVYGDYIYIVGPGSGVFWKANFINNTAYTTLAPNFGAGYAAIIGTPNYSYLYANSLIQGNYFLGYGGTDTIYPGVIFDMSTDTFVGIIAGISGAGSYGVTVHPYFTHKVPFVIASPTAAVTMEARTAVAAYKLPTPITKTTANGMTATYEIEVFWE